MARFFFGIIFGITLIFKTIIMKKASTIIFFIFLFSIQFSCTPSEKALERRQNREKEYLIQTQRESNDNFQNNIDIKQNNNTKTAIPIKNKNKPK